MIWLWFSEFWDTEEVSFAHNPLERWWVCCTTGKHYSKRHNSGVRRGRGRERKLWNTLGISLLKIWLKDWQHQHLLGVRQRMQILGSHPDCLNQKLNKSILMIPMRSQVWDIPAKDIYTKRQLEEEGGICKGCVPTSPVSPISVSFQVHHFLCDSLSISKLEGPLPCHVDHYKSLLPGDLWAGEVFLVVRLLWFVRPPQRGQPRGPFALGGLGEALPRGSESPAVPAVPLASHFCRAWFMGQVGMQAYSLRSHQAVIPPANRKVQCLGFRLAFSVYDLFLVINLEREGRVIASCWETEWGDGGGEGGGMWATPWKANVEPVFPQGHFASAEEKKKQPTKMDFLIFYTSVPLWTQIW